jgi:hypothetical protein
MTAFVSRTSVLPLITHLSLNFDRVALENVFPLEASGIFTGGIIGSAGIPGYSYQRLPATQAKAADIRPGNAMVSGSGGEFYSIPRSLWNFS